MIQSQGLFQHILVGSEFITAESSTETTTCFSIAEHQSRVIASIERETFTRLLLHTRIPAKNERRYHWSRGFVFFKSDQWRRRSTAWAWLFPFNRWPKTKTTREGAVCAVICFTIWFLLNRTCSQRDEYRTISNAWDINTCNVLVIWHWDPMVTSQYGLLFPAHAQNIQITAK